MHVCEHLRPGMWERPGVFHTNPDEIQQGGRDSPPANAHTRTDERGQTDQTSNRRGTPRHVYWWRLWAIVPARQRRVDDPQGSSRGDSHLSSRLSPIAINAANVLLLASGGGAGCAGVLSSVHRNSPAVTRRNEASLAGMEPIADSRPIPKHLKRTYARKRLKSCDRDASAACTTPAW